MRFSILTLLGLVAVAAIGTAALLHPARPVYVGLLPTLTVGCVLASVCGAILLKGGSRSFCIGFAVFGIGYVIFAKFLYEVVSPAAASSYLFDAWRELSDKKLGTQEQLQAKKVFRAVVVFVFATAGGLVARYFYWLRQKQEAGVAEQSR